MPKTNAQKMASRKYRSNNYETVSFEVRKGIRDEYKEAAAELGISLAGFFKAAAEQFIERHGGEVIARPVSSKEDSLSKDERKLVEEFNQLPDELKPTVRKLIQQISSFQNAPN